MSVNWIPPEDKYYKEKKYLKVLVGMVTIENLIEERKYTRLVQGTFMMYVENQFGGPYPLLQGEKVQTTPIGKGFPHNRSFYTFSLKRKTVASKVDFTIAWKSLSIILTFSRKTNCAYKCALKKAQLQSMKDCKSFLGKEQSCMWARLPRYKSIQALHTYQALVNQHLAKCSTHPSCVN